MKQGTDRLTREQGQSAVEFALIAVVVVLMLSVPVDLFRYISTKTTLDSAATEAIAQVQFGNFDSAAVLAAAETMYGEKVPDLALEEFSVSSGVTRQDFTYEVYSSDLAREILFGNRFEARPSNYGYCRVTLQMACSWTPATPLGAVFLGSGPRTVYSDPLTCDIYVGGYEQ